MSARARVVLEIALYLAMAAGILVGTSGRFKLLAFALPLLLMGPFWLVAIRAARRRRKTHDQSPAT